MYREDLFYADPNFTSWTTKGESQQDFELYSERFRRLYPDYLLDSEMRIRPVRTTQVVNLNFLIDLLKSKDELLWLKNKWLFDGQMRFLDGRINAFNKVAFSSIPRSGNSFLRKYLEMLTGISTGSDNTLHLSVIL